MIKIAAFFYCCFAKNNIGYIKKNFSLLAKISKRRLWTPYFYQKFVAQPRRLGDLKGKYYSTVMWDETNAVKKTHTIKRKTCFLKDASQWILSGPHFFVDNPFYKTPRAKCTQNSHYDIIDLTTLPDDYLPRTNYLPDCDEEEYRKRRPKFMKQIPGMTGMAELSLPVPKGLSA